MSASVIVSIVSLIVVSATAIAVTVLVSRALSSAFLSIDKIVQRGHEQQEKLLDRLAAIRWEDLAALRSIQEPGDEGGFFTPEEQAEEVEQIQPPRRWGALRSLGDRMTPGEQELLDEDFNEEGVNR